MADQVENRYKTLIRAMILGCLGAAFILIDGLVLFLTGGLSSDAGPLFPWLGGAFASKNRSSGTGLLVIGVFLVVVLAIGWFTYGRQLRARYLAELQEAGPQQAEPQQAGPQEGVPAGATPAVTEPGVSPTVRVDGSGRGS